MQQKPKLEFEPGKKYKIKLLFDSPKTGQKTNPNGKTYNWYLYGVEYNGNEYTFFADYVLQKELAKYTKGDILEVSDKYIGNEPYKHDWEVFSVGSDKPLDQIMKDGVNETEIKVSVWAAMKVASAISNNLDDLKVNTYSVLELHKDVCKAVKNEEVYLND